MQTQMQQARVGPAGFTVCQVLSGGGCQLLLVITLDWAIYC